MEISKLCSKKHHDRCTAIWVQLKQRKQSHSDSEQPSCSSSSSLVRWEAGDADQVWACVCCSAVFGACAGQIHRHPLGWEIVCFSYSWCAVLVFAESSRAPSRCPTLVMAPTRRTGMCCQTASRRCEPDAARSSIYSTSSLRTGVSPRYCTLAACWNSLECLSSSSSSSSPAAKPSRIKNAVCISGSSEAQHAARTGVPANSRAERQKLSLSLRTSGSRQYAWKILINSLHIYKKYRQCKSLLQPATSCLVHSSSGSSNLMLFCVSSRQYLKQVSVLCIGMGGWCSPPKPC